MHMNLIVLSALAALTACSRPAGHPAGSAPSNDPLVFDPRDIVAAQDISGLPRGKHAIAFDVYAPSRTGWTRPAEQVAAALRVIHLDDRREARAGVALAAIAGRPDARRVTATFELDSDGPWVVILGAPLAPASNLPELLDRYAVRDPGGLPAAADVGFLAPRVLLRAVGPCNHVRAIAADVGADGVLRTMRVQFSEPLAGAAVSRALRVDLNGRDGATRALVQPQFRVTGSELALDLPAQPGAHGEVSTRLAGIPGLAGSFLDTLSCSDTPVVARLGYEFGEMTSDTYPVAPLLEAAQHALGLDHKGTQP